MPDLNKGDFTQQGVNGHVNATVRLNEKRLVNIDMTSNEEAEGCTITGTVKDLINDKVYGIGSGVSGNIEITENGENINVAPYATATVNVPAPTLIVGALRGDAELVTTYKYDKLLVQDENVTIPAYTTSSTNLLSESATIETVAVDENYSYIILRYGLVTPIYDNDTKSAAQQDYFFGEKTDYITSIPKSNLKTLNGTDVTRSTNKQRYGSSTNNFQNIYWTSSTAAAISDSTNQGAAFAFSSYTSISSIRIKRARVRIQGSTTSLNETNWNRITDIRFQYIVKIYRVPLDTPVMGFSDNSIMAHTLDCAVNKSGVLD